MPGWDLVADRVAAIIVCSVLNFAIEKIAYRPLPTRPASRR